MLVPPEQGKVLCTKEVLNQYFLNDYSVVQMHTLHSTHPEQGMLFFQMS